MTQAQHSKPAECLRKRSGVRLSGNEPASLERPVKSKRRQSRYSRRARGFRVRLPGLAADGVSLAANGALPFNCSIHDRSST
ncbi:hypothetical protein SAMN04487785_11041 [Dyella jiangningensis]|nr:hypothetical protein SAMN04487785_11041 [Dyella jiangningensis]